MVQVLRDLTNSTWDKHKTGVLSESPYICCMNTAGDPFEQHEEPYAEAWCLGVPQRSKRMVTFTQQKRRTFERFCWTRGWRSVWSGGVPLRRLNWLLHPDCSLRNTQHWWSGQNYAEVSKNTFNIGSYLRSVKKNSLTSVCHFVLVQSFLILSLTVLRKILWIGKEQSNGCWTWESV